MSTFTIDLLEHALEVAKKAKLRIRSEWLEGAGGLCRIGAHQWLFLDVSLSASEQLTQVAAALRAIDLSGIAIQPELKRMMKVE